jgi:hypothetical protein
MNLTKRHKIWKIVHTIMYAYQQVEDLMFNQVFPPNYSMKFVQDSTKSLSVCDCCSAICVLRDQSETASTLLY